MKSSSVRPGVMSASRVLWMGEGKLPANLVRRIEGSGLRVVPREHAALWPAPRITLVSESRGDGRASLVGRRVAVLHRDPRHAALLAEALRARDGLAHVLTADDVGFTRLDAFTPDAVVVEAGDFAAGCYETVRALWAHTRLRWVPILVLHERGARDAATDPSSLADALDAVCLPADEVERLAAMEQAFEFPVAALGPARALRALLASGRALRVSYATSRARIEVELDQHRILEVRGRLGASEDRPLGRDALAWLAARDQGMLCVAPLGGPSDRAAQADALWSPVSSGVRAALPREDEELTTVYRPSVPAVSLAPAPPESPPADAVETNASAVVTGKVAVSFRVLAFASGALAFAVALAFARSPLPSLIAELARSFLAR